MKPETQTNPDNLVFGPTKKAAPVDPSDVRKFIESHNAILWLEKDGDWKRVDFTINDEK